MSKLETNRWPTQGSRDARSEDSNSPGKWNKTGPLKAVWEPDSENRKKGER